MRRGETWESALEEEDDLVRVEDVAPDVAEAVDEERAEQRRPSVTSVPGGNADLSKRSISSRYPSCEERKQDGAESFSAKIKADLQAARCAGSCER